MPWVFQTSNNRSNTVQNGRGKQTFKQPSWKKKSIKPWQNKTAKYAARDAARNIIHVTRGPTPTQAFVKLKLTGIFNMDIPIGSFNETDLLVNWLNPVVPSGFFSQQPIGFDQWGAQFMKYTVMASKIKISAARLDSGSTSQGLGSLTLLPSARTLTQMGVAMDAGGASGSGTQCAPLSDTLAKTAYFAGTQSDAGLLELKHYCKTSRIFAAKEVRDDPDFSGTTASFSTGAAAPVNAANWFIMYQNNIAVAASNLNIQGRVECTFYCLFSEPVTLYDQ